MQALKPKRVNRCRCKECKRVNAQIRKIKRRLLTSYFRPEQAVA